MFLPDMDMVAPSLENKTAVAAPIPELAPSVKVLWKFVILFWFKQSNFVLISKYFFLDYNKQSLLLVYRFCGNLWFYFGLNKVTCRGGSNFVLISKYFLDYNKNIRYYTYELLIDILFSGKSQLNITENKINNLGGGLLKCLIES